MRIEDTRCSLLVALCCLAAVSLARISQAAVLIRISDQEEFAHQVVEIDGQIWLAMESGAYRVEGDLPIPVLRRHAVHAIAKVDQEVWLGTVAGIFRVRDGEAILAEDLPGRITSLLKTGDTVWIGTQRGLYQFKNSTASPHTPGLVHHIQQIGTDVYVGTRRGAYKIDFSGTVTSIFSNPTEVSDILEIGDHTWFITNIGSGFYGPCYWLDEDRPVEVESREIGVVTVAEVEGEIWLGTTDGIGNLDGERLGEFHSLIDEGINVLNSIDGRVWVGTARGIYFKDGDRPFYSILERPDRLLSMKKVEKIGGQIWVWGNSGVYRYDEEVTIKADLDIDFTILGWNVLLDDTVSIESSAYDRNGVDPYPEGMNRVFYAIMADDLNELNSAMNMRNGLRPSSEAMTRIEEVGKVDIYIKIRDEVGNTDVFSEAVFVIPRLKEVLASMAVVAVVLIAIVLARRHFRLTKKLSSSQYDKLTGLLDRRQAEDAFLRIVDDLISEKKTFGVLIIDIDHFGKFNKKFGHSAGDKVLGKLGAFVKDNIRDQDIAVRWGGEEFVVLLLDISFEETARRAEDLRSGIESMSSKKDDRKQTTVSIGASSFPDHSDNWEDLLNRADEALRRAKKSGRNRVELAESDS